MLVELPDGNWVDPSVVSGIRFADDKEFGPRVTLDVHGEFALYFFHFDDAEAARAWMKTFAVVCNNCIPTLNATTMGSYTT